MSDFITDKFKKNEKHLTQGFPDFIQPNLETWFLLWFIDKDLLLGEKLNGSNVLDPYKESFRMDYKIVHKLELKFKKPLPPNLRDFFNILFNNEDLCVEVLNFLVQDSPNNQQNSLEDILQKCNHEYKVTNIGTEQVSLTKRTPEVLADIVNPVLEKSTSLREAYNAFYNKNPNYIETVRNCCNALEGIINNKYFPKAEKITFGKGVIGLIDKLEKDKSFYSGGIVDSEGKLLEIVKEFHRYRGNHIEGKNQDGKIPEEKDAEFILHTSIIFFYFLK